MLYFSQFPLITTTDYNGNSIVVTNILERVDIIPTLLNDVRLFYSYNIKDGDTPDIIAQKYYTDTSRFWLTMYSNQLFDNAADWPMNSNLFNDYLYDKYSSAAGTYYSTATPTLAQVFAYTQLTIQNYVKSVTTVDSTSLESTMNIYYIDQTAYNSVVQGTNTYSFPSGAICTVTVSAYTQSIYDYEVEMNESKRSINLLNSAFAGQIESQLSTLLKE